MRIQFRPGALAQVQAMTLPALERKAQAAKVELRERLSQPGSGRQHPGQPNRSSAPGEYPAQQTGALVRSIDARRLGASLWGIGAFNAPLEAHLLEYRPPSSGGRPWLLRTFKDATFRTLVARS